MGCDSCDLSNDANLCDSSTDDAREGDPVKTGLTSRGSRDSPT